MLDWSFVELVGDAFEDCKNELGWTDAVVYQILVDCVMSNSQDLLVGSEAKGDDLME